MLEEFKKFAMRGNVVDMAVGIIIGAAFGKIVDSLVKDLIMPPIGLLLGKVDFFNLLVRRHRRPLSQRRCGAEGRCGHLQLRHVHQHLHFFPDRRLRGVRADPRDQPPEGRGAARGAAPDAGRHHAAARNPRCLEEIAFSDCEKNGADSRAVFLFWRPPTEANRTQ